MKSKFLLPETLLGLLLLVICCSGAEAQSEPDSTDNKIWPEADVHVQLPSHVRLLTFGGLEQGIGYPYQQWYAAAGVGYQLKPILKIHLENIDPDKEHWLVFGGGYEFLRTAQSGKISDENRVDSDGIIHFRLTARNLVIDRNRGEFRWVSGVYSTTYRNLLQVEHDFLLHDFRFTPYGSAEVFYDGAEAFLESGMVHGGYPMAVQAPSDARDILPARALRHLQPHKLEHRGNDIEFLCRQ